MGAPVKQAQNSVICALPQESVEQHLESLEEAEGAEPPAPGHQAEGRVGEQRLVVPPGHEADRLLTNHTVSVPTGSCFLSQCPQ